MLRLKNPSASLVLFAGIAAVFPRSFRPMPRPNADPRNESSSDATDRPDTIPVSGPFTGSDPDAACGWKTASSSSSDALADPGADAASRWHDAPRGAANADA